MNYLGKCIFEKTMRELLRPKLELPLSLMEKLLEAVSVLSVIGMFLHLFLVYDSLPLQMPMKMNFDGTVVRVGSKINLLALPVVNLCLYSMLTFFSRFPRIYSYTVRLEVKNATEQVYYERKLAVFLKAMITSFLFFSSYFVLSTPKNLGQIVPYVGVGLLLLIPLLIGTALYFAAKIYLASIKQE